MTRNTPLMPLVFTALLACAPPEPMDLTGGWTADDVDCDPFEDVGFLNRSLEAELDVLPLGDGTFIGDLVVSWEDVDGFYWELASEVELSDDLRDPVQCTNGQACDLELAFDDCEEIDLGDIDCPEGETSRFVPIPGHRGLLTLHFESMLDEIDCTVDLE